MHVRTWGALGWAVHRCGRIPREASKSQTSDFLASLSIFHAVTGAQRGKVTFSMSPSKTVVELV